MTTPANFNCQKVSPVSIWTSYYVRKLKCMIFYVRNLVEKLKVTLRNCSFCMCRYFSLSIWSYSKFHENIPSCSGYIKQFHPRERVYTLFHNEGWSISWVTVFIKLSSFGYKKTKKVEKASKKPHFLVI